MQGLLLSQLQQWAAGSQSHEETLGNGTKHKTQNYPHPKSKGAGTVIYQLAKIFCRGLIPGSVNSLACGKQVKQSCTVVYLIYLILAMGHV